MSQRHHKLPYIVLFVVLSSCANLSTIGNRPSATDKAHYKRVCELEKRFLDEHAYEKWQEFVRTHPSGPIMNVPDPDGILMELMGDIFLSGEENPNYRYGRKANRRKLKLAKHLVEEYGLAASLVPFFESKSTPEGRRFLKESAMDPKIEKTRLFIDRYVDTGIFQEW